MDLKKLAAKIAAKFKLSEKDAEEKLSNMSEDEKKELSNAPDEAQLAAEEDPKDAKMSKHLMENEKLSAEEAKEKLAKMSDEEKKELSAKLSEEDEKAEKENKEKLSAEADEKEAKLSARKEKISRLASDFRKAARSSEVELATVRLTARLSKLKASAKITPAEIKKIDVKKLAAASAETQDAVFNSYEGREPVIIPGMLGSAKGIDLAEINGKIKLAGLEAESRKNMSLKKGTVELSTNEIQENERLVRHLSFAKEPPGYDQISDLIDKGETETAKVALRAALGASGNASQDAGGIEAQLTALQKSHAQLQSKFDEVINSLCEE